MLARVEVLTPVRSAASGTPDLRAGQVAASVQGELGGDGRVLVAELVQLRKPEAVGQTHGLLALRVREPGEPTTAAVVAFTELTGTEPVGIDLIPLPGKAAPLLLVRARALAVSDYSAVALLLQMTNGRLEEVQRLKGWMGPAEFAAGPGGPLLHLSSWYEPGYSADYFPSDLTCKPCPKLRRVQVYRFGPSGAVLRDESFSRKAYRLYAEGEKPEQPLPPEAVAAYRLGLDHLGESRAEAAVKEFLGAVALAPDYTDAWTDLSFAYSLLGRWAESREAAARAVGLNPWHTYAQYNLGLAHLKLGQYWEAERALFISTSLQEERWEVHHALGQAYEGVGERAKAAREYRRALELSPGNREVSAALARVAD